MDCECRSKQPKRDCYSGNDFLAAAERRAHQHAAGEGSARRCSNPALPITSATNVNMTIKTVARASGMGSPPCDGEVERDGLEASVSALEPSCGGGRHRSRGGGREACRDYVKQRPGVSRDSWKCDRPAQPKRPAPAPADNGDDPGKKIADAIALWRDSVDPRGTVVQAYLKSRVLALDDDVAGSVIRWNPRIGAMIALFRNVQTDERKRLAGLPSTMRDGSSAGSSSAPSAARRSSWMQTRRS
jgi:hypothetical protein